MTRDESVRYEGDSWDLASSVGVTATLVAVARALAGQQPDPIVVDPYAEPLVHAVGIEFFTKLVAGDIALDDLDPDTQRGGMRIMTTVMAVRTRFYDDFFLQAAQNGIRQAVILASGLDARAYRLPWPGGTVVYEIDQPEVIAGKDAALAAIGAAPTSDRRAVGIDLRADWPAALRDAGFAADRRTAWIAEGLLAYLPPQAQDLLFDRITELSAPGSRLATEYHPDSGAGIAERAKTMNRWGDHGLDVDLSDLFFAGERAPVTDYLDARGWDTTARTRPQVFADYHQVFPDTDFTAALRDSRSVTAIRK